MLTWRVTPSNIDKPLNMTTATTTIKTTVIEGWPTQLHPYL